MLMTRDTSRLAFSRLVSALLIALVPLLLAAWAPAIRDPATSLRLSDARAGEIGLDRVPGTYGSVVDLVDKGSGGQLYGRLAYRPHAIGSITKLMTVMLAVHHLHLNRIVTVSAKAAALGGSTMGLVAGDRLSVRSLLYGALIPSGNDAAEMLAETMAGNDRGFARLANRQARVYGLKCSHYVTPHGLDAPHQYSCAADAATMSRMVLSNPLLARIVSTRAIVVRGADKNQTFDLLATNLLLNWFKGAIGVKTGTTDAAGYSVSGAARRQGHVLIAVVLGSTPYGRFSDSAALMSFGFRDYAWPTAADSMWSTASLESGHAPTEAPVPKWEDGWIYVTPKGTVSAPFDPR
jgi:serine-type D-Ala-D-Ala carboxypeptidase (penicillin-binding protein 5/6)